ncbi:unnamed protein product [Tilletia controversa]|uniref:DUF788-domain-containing protein n=3 Tax=Tilletia TaxID=13289 RepID=A0A8X7MJM7_9BASI|nr:hypothetical protein CF328_g7720 [Tilletia controversa]KAE8188140.1 hypothetical protein CF335_g6973 [Tilletia laevis]KAE8244210.1 hypothetical protein A4X03_0g7603 [Tilletia caries]KAE8195650.1 hypothetical protein CF336_g2992 [Tilletia laevis]KAE8238326.1 hypothetical protein A4X06_0g8859 [Tilletia controversa]
MAKGAAKKAASSNAQTLQRLTAGFLLSNAAQLLLRFGLFRASATWKLAAIYLLSQAIALFLWSQLTGMASAGVNLAEQKGLTPYIFDVIYVTWFCSLAGALVSDKAWYLYLIIPGFATYLAYTKLVVPYLFGGRDPILSLLGTRNPPTAAAAAAAAANQKAAAGASAGDAQSKRQQKLQKRADRGDPRVRQQK